MDKSFFEIKKIADDKFELFLHKEIDGDMNTLLVKRSDKDVRWSGFALEGLIEMTRLNSMEFGHLQANAKPKILFPPKE